MERPDWLDGTILKLVEKLREEYKKLPAKGKEQENEWSILSSFFIVNPKLQEVDFICLGTGNKCLSFSHHSQTAVNDSHAEIITKRIFQLFLSEDYKNKNSKYFEKDQKTGKFRIKSTYKIIMYITEVPCGDCCISKDLEINDKSEIETGAKRLVDGDIKRTVSLWEEDDINSSLGKTRIKPGRGEKSLSMSCSDKILKWNLIGLQGSILSKYYTKIRPDIILVEGPLNIESLARGINERSIKMNAIFLEKNMSVLPPSFVFEVMRSNIVKKEKKSLSPAGTSINYCYLQSLGEEVTVSARGVKFGAGKNVNKKQMSRLSPLLMKEKFDETFGCNETSKDEQYELEKKLFKESVDGGWTVKV
ncbi:tRNA-specific adenosine deaminase, putative [Entamoeba invadens IP1]|uniref:tRNA-specific adenosine deaminase, putative n=1 Tax=Entamoeba invadens IP1 TaxID=370355 RepID=A0A0A1U7H7_ENTIV|nr:tRNA-specific adenosine deaminase, putative [Entamoeba invadens IP1]ELP87936.1 tRNA-specific adenosine deaminase, putative [Entamoeba invadens IP1]|eukprot:XP_004254707.1 tRNA-specific adenosine deaminase, putative [Entamoeba invadens IP1]